MIIMREIKSIYTRLWRRFRFPFILLRFIISSSLKGNCEIKSAEFELFCGEEKESRKEIVYDVYFHPSNQETGNWGRR